MAIDVHTGMLRIIPAVIGRTVSRVPSSEPNEQGPIATLAFLASMAMWFDRQDLSRIS